MLGVWIDSIQKKVKYFQNKTMQNEAKFENVAVDQFYYNEDLICD